MVAQRIIIQSTDKVKDFLGQLPQQCEARGVDPAAEEIDLDDLTYLVQTQRKTDDETPVSLNYLLADSSILRRIPKKTEPSSLSEIELIRERAKERKYQRSVGHLKLIYNQSSTDVYADYRTSLSMGVNSILGLFLTFFAGYWGAKYIGINDFRIRAFIGLGLSLTCLMIEVVFLITYDEKRRMRAERKEKERMAKQPQQHDRTGVKSDETCEKGIEAGQAEEGKRVDVKDEQKRSADGEMVEMATTVAKEVTEKHRSGTLRQRNVKVRQASPSRHGESL